MQRQGQARQPSNRRMVPATDDEIREKYLERAIRELNAFARRLAECPHCPRGQLMPVLGSGHPQADIFMVKHSARPSEVEEGVAFYGRTGNALMKSLKRLIIDPLAVYGTLCVKCPIADPAIADPACVGRLAEELAIVSPKMLVVMGEGRADRHQRARCAAGSRARAGARRAPALHAVGRGSLRSQHRRVAGRGERQARVLVSLPGARQVVDRPAALLSRG